MGHGDDEEPHPAAERELREEVGITAGRWTDLGGMDLDSSIVRCPVHLFLARDLRFTETDRDSTEEMETARMPLQEAVDAVMSGKITHGPSCVLILKGAHILG